ncbi:TPA: methyl-accepting chemotaxis protein, partial [Klebsiella pneumoniae]|nr:methyl-accepting chemotaxis protein [Klebsiella pneumoniae]
TMEEIVRASGEVTEIMKEIAIASEEQTKGILQVGTAITQMDTVTQQNASLVSNVSETAAGLELQTQALQNSVQKFRLSAAD